MKSFITYKVTNADLFNSVDDVEFDLTAKGGTYKFKYRDAYFQGDVSIEVNGERKTISGQHSANDYEDEYGFQIVKEYVTASAKMRAANAGDDGNDKFFDNAKKVLKQ